VDQGLKDKVMVGKMNREAAAALAAWAVGAYCYDVLWLPHRTAKKARAKATELDGPLLNVGAGTPNSSLRVAMAGPTLWGDVNVDIAAARDVPHGPDQVSYGDAQDLPFPDSTFACVIASHVVEHVPDPQRAIREMERVCYGPTFIIVPKWWCPHTWLHAGHRTFIADSGRIYPLWPQPIAGLLP
jgi:SAM-dependent methyltransferase